MNTKKVVFYFTHYGCLGHSTRLLSIVRNLRKTCPELAIFILHGSPRQSLFSSTKDITHLSVPFPPYTRQNFHSAKKQYEEFGLQRSSFILKAAQAIQPDIFVTEFFPFGRQTLALELLPVLKYLKQDMKSKIICSLGYPYCNLDHYSLTRNLLFFYDRILIHTPCATEEKAALDVFDSQQNRTRYRMLFHAIKSKVSFTNYVLPSHAVSRGNPSPKKMILSTRGAGAYYPRIVTASLGLKKHFRDFKICVVAGPSTSQGEWKVFQQARQHQEARGLRLVKNVRSLPELMRDSAVVVSTAAYNSSVLSLYYGTKNVLIPFSGDSHYDQFWEQPSRARWMSSRAGHCVLKYAELCAESLAKNVRFQLDSKRKPTTWPDSFFNGAATTARLILNEL